MSIKVRADERLVQLSLVESRNKAQALIMTSKVEWFDSKKNEWKRVEKSGQQILNDSAMRLVGVDGQYVGRGALKLLQALQTWSQIPVQNAFALDVGSSTGGFTQVLLEHGAKKVVALDVGTHQLHEKLRTDSRVVSIEQQHVLKMDDQKWSDWGIVPEFDLLVSDLSFISLTKVIPNCWAWLKPGGHWVMLVKPQFELEPSKVPRGIVKSPEHRREALEKVYECILNCSNSKICETTECLTQGTEGNIEYLVWVTKKSF